MVEGKGFVYLHALSIRYFVDTTLQNAANCCVTCARALTADPDFQLQTWQRGSRRFDALCAKLLEEGDALTATRGGDDPHARVNRHVERGTGRKMMPRPV